MYVLALDSGDSYNEQPPSGLFHELNINGIICKLPNLSGKGPQGPNCIETSPATCLN